MPKEKIKMFRVKDKILKELAGDGTKGLESSLLAKKIDVVHEYVYAAIQELKEAKHVEALGTSTIDGIGFLVSISPAGYYFIKNTSYAKERWRQNIRSFPSRYWYIMAFLAFILGWFSDDFKALGHKCFTWLIQK